MKGTESVILRDIIERNHSTQDTSIDSSTSANPSTTSGFPQSKKRWKKPSAFKHQHQPQDNKSAVTSLPQACRQDDVLSLNSESRNMVDTEVTDRQKIDQENQYRIAAMSENEIMEAQKDLFTNLDPSLIKRLLSRSSIEESHNKNQCSSQHSIPGPSPSRIHSSNSTIHEGESTAGSELSDKTEPLSTQERNKWSINEDAPPPTHISSEELFRPSAPPRSKTHFPAAPSTNLPDLDPSHPDFLASLHKKYFPDLPADPAKLAWMAPIPTLNSPADKSSPYYPGQSTLPASALRFDFRGNLVPPHVARAIPVSRGLHHHGEAPEAAGYTVRELALLSRSVVPAQRCIAFQTLGRVMFRLGKGEWGVGDSDEIAVGVWSELKESRVLETLVEAAGAESGHRSSKAFATEALWLFDKGGWKEKHMGR